MQDLLKLLLRSRNQAQPEFIMKTDRINNSNNSVELLNMLNLKM